jgi:hypothetical protein
MDKEHAKLALSDQLDDFRRRSYQALVNEIGSLSVIEVENPSGHPYQIEIQIMWDHKPGGDIRVMGGIDDGGWSAFSPLVESFIITPDGRFL